MIEKIEDYDDALKVITVPSKNNPEGSNFFYCEPNMLWALNKYCWNLYPARGITRVESHNLADTECRFFHNLYANTVLGEVPECIDHINGLQIDNRDINLNCVSTIQNTRNRRTKGYKRFSSTNGFTVRVMLNYESRHCGLFKNEYEAIKATSYYRGIYHDYDYNFLMDRRDDIDLLDAEITKKITPDDAILQHVLRHAKNNAWYYYRYDLAEYFRDNHISIPEFDLDDENYMVDKITRKRLCPL